MFKYLAKVKEVGKKFVTYYNKAILLYLFILVGYFLKIAYLGTIGCALQLLINVIGTIQLKNELNGHTLGYQIAFIMMNVIILAMCFVTKL